jgi:cytochrome c oxidase subunit II
MSETHTTAPDTASAGIGRWLLGGLAGGAIVLGLLIAAYAIGYHRGKHATTPAASATTTAPAPATTAPPAAAGPIGVTPALVERGKALYASDGCTACHSLSGAAGVGPSLEGSAGRTVTLANGQTVTADDSYLERSITDPDAQVVKGYRAGVMSAAITGYDLPSKPGDVRALVAFIKSHR